MRINIKQILLMWNRKDYSKEERLKDLKSLGKFIIKNPEDYSRLLVYIEFPIISKNSTNRLTITV